MYSFLNNISGFFGGIALLSGLALLLLHWATRRKSPVKDMLWLVLIGSFLLGTGFSQMADCSLSPEERKQIQEQQDLYQEVRNLSPSDSLTDSEQERFESLQKKADPEDSEASLKKIRKQLNDLNSQADAVAGKQREAQKQAEEKAAQEQIEAQQEQEAAQQTQPSSQPAAGSQDSLAPDTYECMDGTQVPGTSDPHAEGEANACYGHGGFVINH